MQQVSVDDLENEPRVADVQKHVSDPLNLSDMAMNYYELEPGDSFSGGRHTHADQEEVFYVIEGVAVFETPDETVEVGPNEVIRFAPGEYQEGKNEGDERVRALALGAPQEMGETRTPTSCRECGAEYHVVDVGEESSTLTCPDCGNSFDV